VRLWPPRAGRKYKQMDERRKKERVQVNLDARWEGALTILTGHIVDLSMTGCFILTDDKVTVGELIRLEIQQPQQEPLYLWAEVVYQMSEIGFGVRFTGGDEAEMERLDWLVKIEVLRARNEKSNSRQR
jgi:PilZ domain